MANIVWRNTEERDEDDWSEECRAEGCRSKRRALWRIESDEYEDVVCLFHFAAYVMEFIVLMTGGDASFTATHLARPSKPVPHSRLLGVPPGDISHLIGYIRIEPPKH